MITFEEFEEKIQRANCEEELEELSDLLDDLGLANLITASEYMTLDDMIDRQPDIISEEALSSV